MPLCKYKINHCKCNGFNFHDFLLPLGAVYGYDCKGLYVYTLQSEVNKYGNIYLPIYRQSNDNNHAWISILLSIQTATAKDIISYADSHSLVYGSHFASRHTKKEDLYKFAKYSCGEKTNRIDSSQKMAYGDWTKSGRITESDAIRCVGSYR